MEIKKFETQIALGDDIEHLGVRISPILVENYSKFEKLIPHLQHEKHISKDADILSMSYTEYLFIYVLNNKENRDILIFLMDKVLNINKDNAMPHYEIGTILSNDNLMTINGYDFFLLRDKDGFITIRCNGEAYIDAYDFDEVIDIILHQNIARFEKLTLYGDLRETYLKYLKTLGVNYEPTLIEKMSVLSAHMGLSLEQIKKIPVHHFELNIISLIARENYLIMKSAEIQGALSNEKPIKHWLFDKPDGIMSKVLVSSDVILGKF